MVQKRHLFYDVFSVIFLQPRYMRAILCNFEKQSQNQKHQDEVGVTKLYRF